MGKRKTWVSAGRQGQNFTVLNYGEKTNDGLIDSVGSVTIKHTGNRPFWTANDGPSGVSKGTADDVPQAMLAVETFVRLSEEEKL